MKELRTETFPFNTEACGYDVCGLTSELGGCENPGGSGWQKEIFFKRRFRSVQKCNVFMGICAVAEPASSWLPFFVTSHLLLVLIM